MIYRYRKQMLYLFSLFGMPAKVLLPIAEMLNCFSTFYARWGINYQQFWKLNPETEMKKTKFISNLWIIWIMFYKYPFRRSTAHGILKGISNFLLSILTLEKCHNFTIKDTRWQWDYRGTESRQKDVISLSKLFLICFSNGKFGNMRNFPVIEILQLAINP